MCKLPTGFQARTTTAPESDAFLLGRFQTPAGSPPSPRHIHPRPLAAASPAAGSVTARSSNPLAYTHVCYDCLAQEVQVYLYERKSTRGARRHVSIHSFELADAPPGTTAKLGITTEQSAAHPPGPHCPISLDHHLLRSMTSACRPPLRYTLPSRLLMPHPTTLTRRVFALFPLTTVALDLCRSLQLAVKFLDLCLVIPRFCLSRCVQFDVPRVYIACARCRSCALERRDILVDFTVQPQ